MATKLYVGGLSFDTTDQELGEFFQQAGTVESATIVVDKFSGRSRGFAFVEIATHAEARKAIEELNGKTLGGRVLTVDEARPPREPAGGGRPGGGLRRGGGFQRRGGGGRRW